MAPKCDLHRHLGGSISPELVCKLIGTDDINYVRSRMIVDFTKPRSFESFLDKFNILNEINWNEQAIRESTEDVCEIVNQEGIQHCFISATLTKYAKYLNNDFHHISTILYESINKIADKHQINIGLLLALRYDSPKDEQLKIFSILESPSTRALFKGIDLVGSETAFDYKFYQPIISKCRSYDLQARAHVGEMPNHKTNTGLAIKHLDVNRIAHGIYLSDEDINRAIDKNIIFDMAIHSNMATGSIAKVTDHPLKHMLEQGCQITLNTDDPIQFNCTLEDEYNLATKYLITSDDLAHIKHMSYNSIDP